MTRRQLSLAMRIAQSDEDLATVGIAVLYRCEKQNAEAVYCTMRQAAAYVRRCVLGPDRTFSSKAFDSFCKAARTKLKIVDETGPVCGDCGRAF